MLKALLLGTVLTIAYVVVVVEVVFVIETTTVRVRLALTANPLQIITER